ncbi:hypothetical protein ElyMa_005869100 [Elysia marginata]|uniref:Uncharacterized protein n=1 Tax=Elysia marginata TaxID=1093978 RepID=A0AAV4G210_9GAST|nr:hypothetical protein ElyMa_005869100 [Elysia marginata]
MLSAECLRGSGRATPIARFGLRGSVAEWLARRSRDLEVASSILDHAMLLTFPSPSTCKMGTQLQVILELVNCTCNILHMGQKGPSNLLVCWGISGAALWRHSYVE